MLLLRNTRKTGRVRAAPRMTSSCVLWRRGTAPFALLIAIALLSCNLAAGAGLAAGAQENGQPFRLEPDDYRWQKITIRQTPSQVDCHFEVLSGSPSVHLELLPMSEFRQFDRGLEHETLVATPDGRNGDFRRIIDVSGDYAVVVVNAKRAPTATVAFEVRTTVNPSGRETARTLSPQRRLSVILISFVFFFVTVTWSARTLLRAMRPS
jgi:hypothetical protein